MLIYVKYTYPYNNFRVGWPASDNEWHTTYVGLLTAYNSLNNKKPAETESERVYHIYLKRR